MAGCAWEDSNLVFTDALGHHLTKPTVYRHYKKAVPPSAALMPVTMT